MTIRVLAFIFLTFTFLFLPLVAFGSSRVWLEVDSKGKKHQACFVKGRVQKKKLEIDSLGRIYFPIYKKTKKGKVVKKVFAHPLVARAVRKIYKTKYTNKNRPLAFQRALDWERRYLK